MRRAELHHILSRLPHLAQRVGVVIMGTSEGAMTVSRFDDQKYGRMIVGRVIASYAAEYCYMHTNEDDSKCAVTRRYASLHSVTHRYLHEQTARPPPPRSFGHAVHTLPRRTTACLRRTSAGLAGSWTCPRST